MRRPAGLVLVLASATVVIVGLARRSALAPGASPEAAPARPLATASQTPVMPAALWPTGPAVGGRAAEEATCSIPDRGEGSFGPYRTLGDARVWAPRKLGPAYYLVVHFHGGEGARRLLAPENLGLVLATVDAGQGSSAYERALHDPATLDRLVSGVGEALAPAKLEGVIVSSWSAGYGAVRRILNRGDKPPAAVLLLDSVHAGYAEDGEKLAGAELEPFVALFERAARGQTVAVLTHSEIRPPSYASTKEVADYLLGRVDGRRRYAGLLPAYGVEIKTRFEQGKLAVRGYTGTGKAAHCAHLAMLADILRDDVLPRLAR